jgi:deoxyribonuclease (pyrimidine dimer)
VSHINLVPPGELSWRLLRKELGGIEKVYGKVRLVQSRGITPATAAIPSSYVRHGTGHLRFFYDKVLFVHARHKELVAEAILRGVESNLTRSPKFETCLTGLEQHWLNDWQPGELDLYLNRLYLKDRMNEEEAHGFRHNGATTPR